MTSKRKRESNRRNAQKSTGPRTPSGRAASSSNAIEHGLTAEVHVVLDGEDPSAFDALRDALVGELAPVGEVELELVERASSLMWRLRRVPRFESAILAASTATSARFNPHKLDARGQLGAALRWMARNGDPLLKLSRYEASLDRALARTVVELERRQESRGAGSTFNGSRDTGNGS